MKMTKYTLYAYKNADYNQPREQYAAHKKAPRVRYKYYSTDWMLVAVSNVAVL